MKKIDFLKTAGAALLTVATMTACSSDDNTTTDNIGETETKTSDTYTWTKDGGLNACDHLLFNSGKEDVKGTDIGNGDQEFVFTGTQKLAKGTYTLKGWVYIASGAQLTIEPGTIIKGDKATKAALIVEPGGKLYAQGTAQAPIVFTSAQKAGNRKPGDWGGVIICGKGKTNLTEQQIEGGPRTKFGGSDNNDNSGVLSYVRIEFAGYPFQTDKEINGLTLGCVGSKTQIDHIQVSYSNDDSYEWFGGAVNCKYLIAYHGWDDDFDTDNGYCGNVQFALSIRNPRLADASQSNGFESDNKSDGGDVEPFTTATFSNITFVGPKYDSSFKNTTDFITGGAYFPNNGSSLGRFQAAMHIRRNSRLNCFNSIALGWPIGLILDNEKGDTQGAAESGFLELKNIWMADMDVIGTDFNKIYVDGLYNYESKTIDESQNSFSHDFFLEDDNDNEYFNSSAEWKLTDPFSTGAKYMPAAGSALLTAANFNYAALGSWFSKVAYIGAFSADDTWADGWTNFDPENTAY